ncbi:MAG: hypothetical protein WCJ09_23285 [Planctomycetota bacterium]
MRTINHIPLEFDRGETISQFGLLATECLLVDFIVEPHVQQTILIAHEQVLLTNQFGPLCQRISLGVFRL